jgi:hypothetical protein
MRHRIEYPKRMPLSLAPKELMMEDTQHCASCHQPIPADGGRVSVGRDKENPDKVYHSRCWYEMKTGRPVDFPEQDLHGRMIELVRELERQEGRGESV